MPEHSHPELPELPYDYDALEPHISEQVLTWHHDTHHQSYVNNLAAAEETLAENREAGEFGDSAAAIRSVTHNSGGHYLHTLFWENMHPDGGGEPTGELRDRIEADFGSYEGWKGEFEAAAGDASGWALLAYDPVAKQLRNVVVDNHDEGAIWGSHPILSLDVWEHSYYYDSVPTGAASSTPSSRSSTGTTSRISTTRSSPGSSSSPRAVLRFFRVFGRVVSAYRAPARRLAVPARSPRCGRRSDGDTRGRVARARSRRGSASRRSCRRGRPGARARTP